MTATAQAILLGGLMALRLHGGIKMDKGMQRMQRTRTNHPKAQAGSPTDQWKQVEVEEGVP